MTQPASFTELIETWPKDAQGRDTLAADLGVKPGLPSVWKHRDSIPPEYWPALVDVAVKRGRAGVTFELLARIAPTRKRAA